MTVSRYLFAMLIALALAGLARAAENPKEAAVAKPLLTRALPDVAGKEVTMLTVEYPPGGSSSPHRHNANIFVYVLAGSLVMKVEGGQEVTLKEGETFYESPTDVHVVSRNASTTQPARFLVFSLKAAGAPVTVPVPAHH